jgi:hypothetical protein
MNLGAAIVSLTNGEMICRKSWSDKDMFVFKRPHDILPVDFLPKVKSLPEKVKLHLVSLKRDIVFRDYLCMFNGEIVNGWIALQEDLLADDWTVFNFETIKKNEN